MQNLQIINNSSHTQSHQHWKLEEQGSLPWWKGGRVHSQIERRYNDEDDKVEYYLETEEID